MLSKVFFFCGVKPAPGVFPGLSPVTEAAGKFQFGQPNLESETSNLMHFTSNVLAATYTQLSTIVQSLGCPCLSKKQTIMKLSVCLNLCLIIFLHRHCV